MPRRQDDRPLPTAPTRRAPARPRLRPIRQLVASATPRWFARLGRRFRVDRPEPGTPSAGAILAAAVTVGTLAGLLELAVVLLQRDVLLRVSRSSQFTNRHALWMIPAAEFLAILGISVLVLLPARRLAPRRAEPLARFLLGGLLALGPALAVKGLHPAAAVVLAAGFGSRISALMARNKRKSWKRLRRFAAPAGAILAGFVVWQFARVAGAERRGFAASAVPPAGTPSLLWVVMDTVRADHLSLHGYARDTTPNLARWAARGITFDQARSAAPWTLPSHMTMLTGLWPGQHKVRIDRTYTSNHPFVAEHLRSRGFATAAFVANHGCGNACFGFARGFDLYVDHEINQRVTPATVAASSALGERLMWLGRRLGVPGVPAWPPVEEHAPAATIFARADAWLARRDAAAPDRPFFLFLNLMDAHGPYRPPADYPRAYFTAALPTSVRATTPELGFDALRLLAAAPEPDRAARRAAVDAASRQLADLYDDCLRDLDARLGAQLDDLERRGLLQNTWVVVTSDHGEQFGEHAAFGHGGNLYDELVHVPLVVIPPLGLPANDPSAAARGRRVAEVVSLRDLPATVSTLLLPAVPHPYPGRPLSIAWGAAPPGASTAPADPPIAQLAQQSIDDPDAVDAASMTDMDAVFALDRSFIRSRVQTGYREELYHLPTDPAQAHDLSAAPGEAANVARLRAALEEQVRANR